MTGNGRPFAEQAPLELRPGDVHLWWCSLDAGEQPDYLARCLAVLSEDEMSRLSRLKLDVLRARFAVSHALVRHALGRHYGISPEQWRFRAGPEGRPEVDFPSGTRLRYNLSHTATLALCGVTLDSDLGVDVESLDAPLDIALLAAKHLAEPELASWAVLDAQAGKALFLTYWTLKEAYAKATGEGLSFPLRGVSFECKEGGAIEAHFTAPTHGDSEEWFFSSFEPSASHVAALALHRPRLRLGTIQVQQVRPLAFEHEPEPFKPRHSGCTFGEPPSSPLEQHQGGLDTPRKVRTP